MGSFTDIKSPDFLGGSNVHSLILIGLSLGIAWKVGLFRK